MRSQIENYIPGAQLNAKLHGDLHIDLPVNFQKGGYDKQSDGWKELKSLLGKLQNILLQYTKWSGDFDSQISMNPDSVTGIKTLLQIQEKF